MIKILIADDHAMFRDGLRRVLETDRRMVIVGEAADGAEMIRQARAQRPDLVLLDVRMPGRGGLEGLEDLKRWNPKIKVLMLTALAEDHYGVRCLKAGADGYLTKENAASTLIAAILKIHRGSKYISAEMAEKLVLQLGGELDRKPHDVLSGREFQVLCLLGSGRTVTEIADELNLSVKTVSTYRSRILDKLDLHNTAEIIRYALQEGLTA